MQDIEETEKSGDTNAALHPDTRSGKCALAELLYIASGNAGNPLNFNTLLKTLNENLTNHTSWLTGWFQILWLSVNYRIKFGLVVPPCTQ